MNDINKFRLNEEEVLLAFAVEPHHDQETLERYISDYPEHSKALASLSVELMIDENLEEQYMPSSVSSINNAWSRFCSAVDSTNREQALNPFSELDAIQLKKVAEAVGINKLMLVRFRDRGIDLATIPIRFIERAATALSISPDILTSYLSRPPCMASDLSFRSDVKPIATEQISFSDAIESSHLTEEQKEDIKSLMEG